MCGWATRGALLGLVLTCLVATSCRRAPETLSPPPVPEATRRFAGVTLTFYGDSPGRGPALERALAERFTADTGIEVEIRKRPPSVTETHAVYDRLFRAKQPNVDVLLLDVIWPGAFAPHLLDLRPAFERTAARNYGQCMENNTVDGRLVAMPYFIDMGLLYYRTDLLERSGFSAPPRTWDELERMARRIQSDQRKERPTFWGFTWQGAPHEALTCNALEWQVSQGGGRLVSPEGRIEMAGGAIAAFERAAGWVGTLSPLGVTSHEESDSVALFKSGDAAFMRNWAYVYAECNAAGSPVLGRFAVAPLPRGAGPSASVLGGWQLGVSRYSRHPEAAMELVRYLTSPEVQAWRAVEASYIPTIPSVVARPEVQAAQPYLKDVNGRMERLVARPSAVLKARYPAVSRAYFEGVSGILEGEGAAQSVARMRGEIERVMAWPESSVRTPGGARRP